MPNTARESTPSGGGSRFVEGSSHGKMFVVMDNFLKVCLPLQHSNHLQSESQKSHKLFFNKY